MILIQSLLGGNDGGGNRADTNAPQGKRARDDAYSPRPQQEELLSRVREEAQANAIRHAEDMANRLFPVSEEAESIGIQRVAVLGAAYAAARGRLDAEVDAAESQVNAAEVQLKKTEEVLEEAGVAAERVGLAPLGDRMVSSWQLALALGIGAFAGLFLARLGLNPLGIGLVCVAVLGLIFGLLSMRIGQPESAALTGLRRNRKREAARLEKLKAALKHKQALVRGLVAETLRLAEAEVAFAKQLVATYESAASSALPVGSLGEGERAIRKQREPHIPIPLWIEELEEEA